MSLFLWYFWKFLIILVLLPYLCWSNSDFEKLQLLVIVSGYHDLQKNFKVSVRCLLYLLFLLLVISFSLLGTVMHPRFVTCEVKNLMLPGGLNMVYYILRLTVIINMGKVIYFCVFWKLCVPVIY